MDGLLTEVLTVPQGSAATADVAIGEDVVPVENLTDFSIGNRIDIAGVIYDVAGFDTSDVDPEGVGGSLQLASPLTEDVAEFDPVLLLVGDAPAIDFYWVVDQEDNESGEPMWLPIVSQQERLAWPVRTYDPPLPVTVVGGRVVSADGLVPQMDGGLIDPGTIPAPEVTEPPADSPTLTTSGSNEAITVVATGDVDPTTTLDYYLDGVLMESTRSSVMVFRTDSAGEPLQLGTTYQFHVIARNLAGEAAASPDVPGALNPDVPTETILAVVKAGFALVGSLTVGGITIKPPSGTPGAVGYDPGGIVIPLTTGGEIRFPADGSPALIEAVLRTADLAVQGGLAINGVTNTLAGKMFLGSGTPDPATKPAISASANARIRKRFNGTANSAQMTRGLARTADGTKWATIVCLPTGGEKQLTIVDDATGDVTATVHSDDAVLNFLSVTAIGSDLYALGKRWNATAGAYQWRVHKYSTAGALLDSWWLLDSSGARIVDTNPGGYDDGAICAVPGATMSLYVAKVLSNNRLSLRLFSGPAGTSGTTWQTSLTVTGETTFTMDFLSGGMSIGEADFGPGNTRFVIPAMSKTAPATNACFSWTLSGSTAVHDTANDFSHGWRPEGLIWDGTRFVGSDADSAGAYAHDYNTVTVDTTVYAKHTWYDNNPTGGNKESAPSPAASLLIPKRQWPYILVPAPPNSGTGDDPANAVRLYVGSSAAGVKLVQSPAPISAGPAYAITTGQSATVVTDLVGAGGAPPAASTFTAASATGELLAQVADRISLKGDGSWKLGELSGDTNGRIHFQRPRVIKIREDAQVLAPSTFESVKFTTLEKILPLVGGPTNTSGTVTVNRPGSWEVDSQVWWDNVGTGRRVLEIRLNGVPYARTELDAATLGAQGGPLRIEKTVTCLSGDTIEIWAWHNHTANVNILGNAAASIRGTWCEVTYDDE